MNKEQNTDGFQNGRMAVCWATKHRKPKTDAVKQ